MTGLQNLKNGRCRGCAGCLMVDAPSGLSAATGSSQFFLAAAELNSLGLTSS
jgi:hypothetical protein